MTAAAKVGLDLPHHEEREKRGGNGRDSDGDATTLLGPILSAGQLLSSPPQSTQWIVDGWISEGASVLLGAHGGTGKSVLALQLAACLAAGRRFLRLATRPQRVLFYSAEDPTMKLNRAARRRIRKTARTYSTRFRVADFGVTVTAVVEPISGTVKAQWKAPAEGVPEETEAIFKSELARALAEFADRFGLVVVEE